MNQLHLHLETVSRALEALARRNATERPLLTLAACHLRLLCLIDAPAGNSAAPLRPDAPGLPGTLPQPRDQREGGHVLQ